MAFESTNAILGIRGMEEQKKSNRWAKLMDIANVLQNTAGLGADIWKTVSGRKYEQTAADAALGREKELASFTNVLNYGPDSLKMQYEKGLAEMDLTYKQKWLDYQNEHPGKPADQLYAEWLQTPEGQSWQADQEEKRRAGATFDHALRMKEILANQGGGISQAGWATYDKAISNAISTFYEQDETGKYVLRKGVTAQNVSDFLNGFLDPAFASASDIPGLKKAFTLWLSNPDFAVGGGGGGGNAEKTPGDIGAILQQLADIANRAREQNPELDLTVPQSEGAKAINDPSSLLSIVGGPMAGFGYAMDAKTWYESDENALATDLAALLPKITDTKDADAARGAMSALSAGGKVESFDVYEAFRKLKESLSSLYGNVVAPKNIRDTPRK